MQYWLNDVMCTSIVRCVQKYSSAPAVWNVGTLDSAWNKVKKSMAKQMFKEFFNIQKMEPGREIGPLSGSGGAHVDSYSDAKTDWGVA